MERSYIQPYQSDLAYSRHEANVQSQSIMYKFYGNTDTPGGQTHNALWLFVMGSRVQLEYTGGTLVSKGIYDLP